ncbi:MAG: response regulator [Chloroflexota bacterium]
MTHRHIVLVVDDERDVRDLFADTLRENGHHVEDARDGDEALRLVDEGLRPCLVLSDVMMPRMDGWDLNRALGKRFPDLPVVLVTGDRLLSIRAPVRDKPASPDELEAMIRSYCPLSGSEEEADQEASAG